MSLESPQTYAEWYWKHGVDAKLAEQEKYEKELVPHVQAIIQGLPIMENLPPELATFMQSLQNPTAPAWAGVLARFTSEVADGVVGNTMNAAMMDFNYKMQSWFKDLRIDKDTCCVLQQRRKIHEDMYKSRMEAAGFKEAEATAFYESRLPYPSIPDLILYARYHGDPDTPRETVWKSYDVPEEDFELWSWGTMQRMTTEQVLTMFKRGILYDSDAQYMLSQIGWNQEDRTVMLDLAYSIPNAMLLLQAGVFQEAEKNSIMEDLGRADIHPDYQTKYIDAILAKPNIQDLINYQLRVDPSLDELPHELGKIGIHPAYHDLYRTLAYPIPPVADIITMAVREAFTPAIAQRFGQYEDYPPEFEAWALKKGISKEWAQRYWAAHWSLPSPQQGFEMLHRGVIDESDLNLLLRASDVMPFWRDKLIQIAYHPLTRVDVRRMHLLGVLKDSEVEDAYKHIGYSDTNARRMMEFTSTYNRKSVSGYKVNDVIRAYSNRFIGDSEAITLLLDLDLSHENAEYAVRTAGVKREWDTKDDQLTALESQFKSQTIDEGQARTELTALRFSQNDVSLLIKKWTLKHHSEKEPTWTAAQTLKFLSQGIITQGRASQELTLIGYNPERVDVFLASVAMPQK